MEDSKAETAPLKEGNISLILDSYEDIFSDFDPRPYGERALSDDFLAECKRASREKATGEGVELRLLMPKKLRKPTEETKIKKRLKDHFQKHHRAKEKELNANKRQGILWVLAGATLITTSALFHGKEQYLFRLLVVILDPSGWFSTWIGLEKVFSKILEKHPDLEFYQKMAKVEIKFYDY